MLSRNSIYSAQEGDSPVMPDRDQPKSRAKAPRQPASRAEGPDLAFDPIAAALRQLHESVAAEEIPDDFLDLLDQLDDLPDANRSSTE
jgi:hypothetical protein